MTQLLYTTPERRAEMLYEKSAFLYGIHIHKLAPYKTIYLSITSLTTPLSKIRSRQVVDIGEANPTLSKNFKSDYFLMPKHVPNVVAITRYRTPTHNLRAIQIHSSTNHQPYNALIKNMATTSCGYR